MIYSNLATLIISLLFISVVSAEPLQHTMTSYNDWKQDLDSSKKSCATDGKELSARFSPDGTANNYSLRARRWMSIPVTSEKSGQRLDGAHKSKLAAIESAAKKHFNVKWNQVKASLSPLEKEALQAEEAQIKHLSGLATVRNLKNAVPEDFLKGINYEKNCDCKNSSESYVKNEAEYNKLTMRQFMERQEDTKLKCFLQNVSL